jgi:response regulator RpfG family c-di-GMP phosphodiesterase
MLNVLIVDDEEDILDILEVAIEMVASAKILKANSGKLALSLLAANPIDLIICDYNMPIVNGGHIYQHIVDNLPHVKYVMCSSADPQSYPVFNNRSAFFGHIQKPEIMQGVSDVFTALKMPLTMQKAPNDEGNEYFAITTKLLLHFNHLHSPVFIKIAEEKYVQIYQKGDLFDETDFVKLSQKDVHYLYIKKRDERILKDELQAEIVKIFKTKKNDDLSGSQKAHSMIRDLIAHFGFSHDLLPVVETQIKDALEVTQTNKDLSLLLKNLLSRPDSYITQHSFLLTVLTVYLADRLHWMNDSIHLKLVVTSLYHDIYLTEDEIEAHKYKKETSERFKKHPELASALIKEIPKIPEDTYLLVLEHHEIGEQGGFPKRTPAERLSSLGELFIFCHFVADYLIEGLSLPQILDKIQNHHMSSQNIKKYYDIIVKDKLYE